MDKKSLNWFKIARVYLISLGAVIIAVMIYDFIVLNIKMPYVSLLALILVTSGIFTYHWIRILVICLLFFGIISSVIALCLINDWKGFIASFILCWIPVFLLLHPKVKEQFK